MHLRRPRLLREKNPDFDTFALGGTHIREVPPAVGTPFDRVLISLPWSYNQAPDRYYPVIYLCDGYWDFPLVWSLYSHLLSDNAVSEYILVGLAYAGKNSNVESLRKHDLAPPAGLDPEDDYLFRLREQVIPFVEAEYGCDSSFRAIAGVSIGGAFALSTLFRAPGLFNGVIALSPTVAHWDRWLFRLEQEYIQAGQTIMARVAGRRRELDVQLFLAAGDADDAALVREIQAYDRLLDARKYRMLTKQFRLIDGEKHAGLKAEGFNRGLRHLFAPRLASH
jgi:enterochelin esterase-like enzyme